MANVTLNGLTKRFGKTTAIDDLSLDVANGEFVVLLGPTGAGKTTTLRLVAGLERPDAGSVHIDGQDVTRLEPAGRDMAFVFQQYSLYPHLTVYDNLAFPLRSPARRVSEAEIAKLVEETASLLQDRAEAQEPGDAAVGRRDAASGDRPGAGAQTLDLSHGRAAVVARRQAQGRSEARAQAHPDKSRRDDPLCDATTRSKP